MTRDEIKKALLDLTELHKAGALTEAEFQQEKAPLLAQLRQSATPVPTAAATPPPQATPLAGHDFYSTGGGTPPSTSTPSPLPGSPVPDGESPQKTGPTGVQVGQLLLGRYRLERLLGSGGMGQVYLCQDQTLNRSYALKVIHPYLAQQEEIRRRFLNELAITEHLTHPGIVRSFTLSQDPATGYWFYTMEFVEGQTLEAILEKARQEGKVPPLPLERTLELLASLVEPLEYAHNQGVIHRDLKPANVMVLPSGGVKLMDFGIAKAIEGSHTTRHTGFTGSVYYMAPEQLKGGGPVTPAADIYSLGVMTYQMVTGEVPVGRIIPPSQLCQQIPSTWDDLVLQAMDPRPEERYPSARAFLNALQGQEETKPAIHVKPHLDEPPTGYVLLKPGSFLMGSPEDDWEAKPKERPAHQVTLTKGIYMKTTPVTQAEWEKVMGFNPSNFKGADRPVECVTWYEVVAYCNALSQQKGLTPAYRLDGVQGNPGDNYFRISRVVWDRDSPGYRLPTEAEWEYACRAGMTTPRYGDLSQIAWCKGNSDEKTHPVGQKQPNAWGLYDMLGNVFEFVYDTPNCNYSTNPAIDPVCEIGTAQSPRSTRGGSWLHKSWKCRAAHRNEYSPKKRCSDLGLRICRTVS